MLGWKLRDLAVWLAYLIMLAVTVPWHEPWNDEAQAWLLARDLSIPKLLLHGLRYESHPPLWYLILWVPTHLHLGYFTFCWISAVIAAAGIYVLLRLSPFPFYLRAVLPFTFYLAYQYSVVARSYVLFPLLCFLAAQAYRMEKPRRPVVLAVFLALLANVSIHGTLVACTFAAAYGWNCLRSNRTDGVARRSLLAGTLIFATSLAIAALSILPVPRDMTTVASPTVTRVLLGAQTSSPLPVQVQPVQLPSQTPPAAQPQQGGLRGRIAGLPSLLSYSISSSHLIAFALYVLIIAFLYVRSQLFLLLPLIAVTFFLCFVYGRSWHLGLIYVTVLMILWAAWNPNADITPGLNLQKALGGLLFVICLLQLPWTWRAIRYDIHSPYSGAKATAAYLHTLPGNLRIAAFGPESTAILPYFGGNIFFNQPTTFWFWSTHNTIDSDMPQTIATHPDVIVLLQQFNLAQTADDNPILDYAQASGYRETHRFCGSIFMHDFKKVPDSCYVVLQPNTGKS